MRGRDVGGAGVSAPEELGVLPVGVGDVVQGTMGGVPHGIEHGLSAGLLTGLT